jgi:hypothetical protein
LGILKRTGPPSISQRKKGSKYYCLTSFGIFFSILNESGKSSHNNIVTLIENNLNDKLFVHFLYPYISKGTLIELKDKEVIEVVWDFLRICCEDIIHIFYRLDEFKKYGGRPTSGFMTYLFEVPESYDELAGPQHFIYEISNIFSIKWIDIKKVKLQSLVPFTKYQITDGFRKLILQIKKEEKIALLYEGSALICKFTIDEYENTYHEICPIVPMELDDYFNEHIGENLINDTTFEKLCDNIVNFDKGSNVSDLLLLYRDSNFRQILDVYTKLVEDKYDRVKMFHSRYSG